MVDFIAFRANFQPQQHMNNYYIKFPLHLFIHL